MISRLEASQNEALKEEAQIFQELGEDVVVENDIAAEHMTKQQKMIDDANNKMVSWEAKAGEDDDTAEEADAEEIKQGAQALKRIKEGAKVLGLSEEYLSVYI